MTFFGWQKQDGVISVQETLEKAIAQVFNGKEKVELFGAGRTDTGVHALGQVAHFNIYTEVLVLRWQNEIGKLVKAINYYLINSEIIVLSAEVVSNDFHARFSARMRHYEYLIYNRKIQSVLMKDRAWHVPQKLDIQQMIKASRHFIGTHNLNSFRSARCNANNPVRTISMVNIQQYQEIIKISISSKSFLHNQVRIMVGTLKFIGENKMDPDEIKALLIEQDRTNAGPTAPPYGLYFKGVEY